MIREINSSVEAWLVNFQGFADAGQLAVVSYPTLGEGRLDKWLGAEFGKSRIRPNHSLSCHQRVID